jgi:hypothetical protein
MDMGGFTDSLGGARARRRSSALPTASEAAAPTSAAPAAAAAASPPPAWFFGDAPPPEPAPDAPPTMSWFFGAVPATAEAAAPERGRAVSAAAAPSGAPAAGSARAGLGGMERALKVARGLVSKKKKRFQLGGYDLDLTYVTDRLLAMGFPSEGAEGLYRNPLHEVQRFFAERHAGRFMIMNLCSERAYDRALFGGAVQRWPFDDHNPPPLDLIPRFCAAVDAWLAADPRNVVAVHCKAGKGRTGLLCAAYLVHAGYCATAEEALDYFGRVRTHNNQGVTIPSQMRYVHYYEHVLRYGPPPVVPTLRLTRVRIVTVPRADAVRGHARLAPPLPAAHRPPRRPRSRGAPPSSSTWPLTPRRCSTRRRRPRPRPRPPPTPSPRASPTSAARSKSSSSSRPRPSCGGSRAASRATAERARRPPRTTRRRSGAGRRSTARRRALPAPTATRLHPWTPRRVLSRSRA